jgi:cell division protein ZapA
MSDNSIPPPENVSQVVVNVNDRPYAMQCDPGEEDHLSELAQLIDTEVSKLKRNFGQVGDTRLLLMAGLVVADKLASALNRIEQLQEDIQKNSEAGEAATTHASSMEDAIAERIEAASERLEALAREVTPES